MTEEFNLSRKGKRLDYAEDDEGNVIPVCWYREDNVKEFIKRLKDFIDMDSEMSVHSVKLWIDKLAGEKLI